MDLRRDVMHCPDQKCAPTRQTIVRNQNCGRPTRLSNPEYPLNLPEPEELEFPLNLPEQEEPEF